MDSIMELETFQALNTIRERISVTDPNEVGCYAVWGDADDNHKTGRAERLADAWKAAWNKEQKEKTAYYLELDMSEFAEEENVEIVNWRVWFDLVKRLSELVPVEDMEANEYKKKKIASIYQYFTEKMRPEDMDEDHSVTAQIHLERLFKCYTDLEIHVTLVFRNFECCRKLFPKEKDTNFFRTLFNLSTKGRPEPLNLGILLCSTVHVGTIAHHDQDISPVVSAYPDGVAGEGNLTNYEEAAFESYLKSFE